MNFNDAGKPIDKATMDKMVNDWRSKYPDQTRSETFDVQAINEILQTPGAAGVTIYNGLDNDGKLRVIITACNAEGKTIYPTAGGTLLEFGRPCPPYCQEED